ncbi:MAG: hypothetical protein ACP5NW_06155 [Candidatus Woesearchaeota archaeon]
MPIEKELMDSIKKGIFSNQAYNLFKRLNELLSRDLNMQETLELKKIYEDMHLYLKNLDESSEIVKRIIRVIDERYPNNKKEPFYILLKMIDDENTFTNMKKLLIEESRHYNEGNFIDWQNLLIERQKYTTRLEQNIYRFESKEWKTFIRNIWSIPVNLAANTYLLFRKMMMLIFPRVKEYENIGSEVTQYCNNRFRQISHGMDARTREYLERYYNTPSFRAYVLVMAHITYIDYDVFHEDARIIKNRLFEAGFRIGMDWLLIKIMDEMIDRKIFDHHRTSLVLDDFEKAINGKDFNNINPSNGDTYYFLDAVRSFQKHYRQSPEREKAGQYLRTSNEKFLSRIKFTRKLLYAKAIGKYSADISLHDMILEGIPVSTQFSEFIREKGMAGNLFDDWKDYNIDRQQGIGYDDKRFKILCTFLKQYWKTLKTMDLKAKARFMDFCILAGLFQISELVKLKERT